MEGYKGTRKITRRETDADIKLKMHESSKRDVKLLKDDIKARMHDISDNGIGIRTSVYIPEGVCMELELDNSCFSPEAKGSVHIVAKVTSCVMAEDGYRIGLQFIEISGKDREVIKKYIQG